MACGDLLPAHFLRVNNTHKYFRPSGKLFFGVIPVWPRIFVFRLATNFRLGVIPVWPRIFLTLPQKAVNARLAPAFEPGSGRDRHCKLLIAQLKKNAKLLILKANGGGWERSLFVVRVLCATESRCEEHTHLLLAGRPRTLFRGAALFFRVVVLRVWWSVWYPCSVPCTGDAEYCRHTLELRPRISPISSGVGTALPIIWALMALV